MSSYTNTMRRQLLSLSLILVFTLSAAGQITPASASLPRIDRLREHVTYLASDKLEGRRTGGAGANLAAEYIAKEFARLGLRRSIGYDTPGMSIIEADSPRRYMQEFPFVAGVELGRNNSMLFTPIAQTQQAVPPQDDAQPSRLSASFDLRVGEDWLPLGFSSNALIKGAPATFVGYGIKADEINYDDYAGVQVAGRLAVAFEGTPDGDNPHGHFSRFAGVRWKAIAARNAGAAALLVIAAEENFKDDRLSRLAYDNSGGEAGLPVVVVSRQVAQRMFEAGGLGPVAAVEKGVQEFVKNLAQQSGPEKRRNVSTPLQNVTLTLTTEIVRRNAPAYNVVGILEGSDSGLKDEAIIIGAHYDHLGRGGEGSLAPREGEVHHGADDNASGVAGMLELARIFAAERKSLKRTLVFIAFSGEEEGLLGSNYYVNHAVWPMDKTIAMMNMDMIGRMKENRLMIGGVGTSPHWGAMIAVANVAEHLSTAAGGKKESMKIPIATSTNGQIVATMDPATRKVEVETRPPTRFTLTLNEDGYGPSDHSSFYAKQVPVLFFFTGTHDDYHKPSDTADKIAYEDEARVVSFVADIVRKIDSGVKRPPYAVTKSQSAGRGTGFKVYLGTIPNYSESNDGLRLDGVREGSPAAKAGLKAGDRITRMAGREVRNVYDYTYVLGEMKAGQEYEVEVVRGSETLKLKLTPEARK